VGARWRSIYRDQRQRTAVDAKRDGECRTRMAVSERRTPSQVGSLVREWRKRRHLSPSLAVPNSFRCARSVVTSTGGIGTGCPRQAAAISAPAYVAITRVGPFFAGDRTCLPESEVPPSPFAEVAVTQAEPDHFRRTHRRVQDAAEERYETPHPDCDAPSRNPSL